MKNNKTISPVVATALLLVVAVVSVVGFQNWYTNYGSSIQSNVEQQNTFDKRIDIQTIAGNTVYIKSNSRDKIEYLKVEDKNSNTLCEFKNTLDDDLVLYLPFEDVNSSDYTPDLSSAGDDGLLQSGTNCEVDGISGNACSFDDTPDTIFLENLNVNTSIKAKNTVQFWMNWKGGNREMPFDWANIYDLFLHSDCFGFNTGQSNILGFSSTNLKNKWVFVSAIFYNGKINTTNNELYINGIKQDIYECLATTTNNKSIQTLAYIATCNPSTSQYDFNGQIDEFEIYNRELTDSEIKNAYNFYLQNTINEIDLSEKCNLLRGEVVTVFGYTKNSKFEKKLIVK